MGPEASIYVFGVGRVVNYRDNFTEVYERDGTQTFCLEFELDCRDGVVNPAFIGNFDDLFEEGVPEAAEGRERWVRHKPERNPEIVRSKKKHLARAWAAFCEVLWLTSTLLTVRGVRDLLNVTINCPCTKWRMRELKMEDLSLFAPTVTEWSIGKGSC